jgi:hypothetical protein
VGTGLNAPEGFDVAMAAALSRDTGIAFEPARNKFEALASHDGAVAFSGMLIVLLSVSIIGSIPALYFAGLGLGLLGSVSALNGFLLFFG